MLLMPIRRLLALGAILAALCAAPAAAQPVPVDLELILAVDVSGSMDFEERRLQRDGYVEALRHPEVIAAITSGVHGRIALAYFEWGGPGSHRLLIPWRIIDGPEAALAVSAQLDGPLSPRVRGTSISGSLVFAATLFEDSEFESFRKVIDISGDGPNNAGMPVAPVRDWLVSRGIVINGLPLLLNPGGFGGQGMYLPLDVYFEDCVIGGFGAFVLPVRGPEQIADAIRRKLVLEIAGHQPGVLPAQFDRPQPRIDCMIGERDLP